MKGIFIDRLVIIEILVINYGKLNPIHIGHFGRTIRF